MPSEQQSQNHLPIRCAEVYPLDREQWTGYCTGYVALPSGERVTFTTIAAGFPKEQGEILSSVQTNADAAWKAFDLGLKDWLKNRPGVVLWRTDPTLHTEREYHLETFSTLEPALVGVDHYYVFARVAVTENRDFLDPDKIGPDHLPTRLPIVGTAA